MSGNKFGGKKGGKGSPRQHRADSLEEEEEDLPSAVTDQRRAAAAQGLRNAGATRPATQAAARVVRPGVGRTSLFINGKLDLANLRYGNPVYETPGEVTDKPELKISWWEGLLANVPVLNKIALSEATRKAIDDANAQLDEDLNKIDQEVAGLGAAAAKLARDKGFRSSMQRFSMRVQEAIQKDPAPELKKQDWKKAFEKTWESFSKNFALLMEKLGSVASNVRRGVKDAATSAAERMRSAASNLKQKAEGYTKAKPQEASRSARVDSNASNTSNTSRGRANSGAAKQPANFLKDIGKKPQLKKVETNDRSAPDFSGYGTKEPQSNVVKPAVPARPAGLSFGNKQQGNSPKAVKTLGSFSQGKPASPKAGSTGNPAMDFARVAASKQQSNLKPVSERARTEQPPKQKSQLEKKLEQRRAWEQGEQGNQSPKGPKKQ